MRKLLLHLGAHKTASTYIQHNLIANRDTLANMHWRFVYFFDDFAEARRKLLRIQKGDVLDAAEREPLDDFFTQMKNEPGDVFLSSEDFLGSMNMMESGGDIYPGRQEMAEMLRDNFGDRKITVAFCMRDFGDFIESSYNWLVRLGATYNFNHYLKNIDTNRMSWLSVVQTLSDTFGAENLVLWTYEDFQRDAVESFRVIMAASGIDPVKLSVPLTSKKNPSYPPDVIEVLLGWNKLLKSRKSLSKEKTNELRSQMRRILGGLPRRGKNGTMLPPRIQKQLSEQYQDELTVIRRDWPNAVLHLPEAKEEQA